MGRTICFFSVYQFKCSSHSKTVSQKYNIWPNILAPYGLVNFIHKIIIRVFFSNYMPFPWQVWLIQLSWHHDPSSSCFSCEPESRLKTFPQAVYYSYCWSTLQVQLHHLSCVPPGNFWEKRSRLHLISSKEAKMKPVTEAGVLLLLDFPS